MRKIDLVNRFEGIFLVCHQKNWLFWVVMGLSQNNLTRVGSGQIFVARVGSAIFDLGLENFP